ncbi:hypothetical protein D3C81_647820 [compost metagenome]
MRYNTGNPVGPDGSNSPFDLFDNSGVLDLLLNGPLGEYLSRLGVPLKSWRGIMQQVTDYLIAQGYESVYLTYGAGVVVERQTQLVQRSGELYRVMNAADIPLTLTGTWATDAPKLQAVGDAALRQALALPSGAGILGFSESQSYPPGTVGEKLKGIDDDIEGINEDIIETQVFPSPRGGNLSAQVKMAIASLGHASRSGVYQTANMSHALGRLSYVKLNTGRVQLLTDITGSYPAGAFDPINSPWLNVYYVDPILGADPVSGSPNGKTWATAFKRVSTALSQANVDAVICRGGVFYKIDGVGQQGLTNYTASRDVAIIAVGKPAVFTTAREVTWSANVTYPAVFQSSATGGAITKVLDAARLDADGDYTDLTQVASLAACAATPGSWYFASNVVYLNPLAGRTADASILPLRSALQRVSAPNVKFYHKNIHYIGGSGGAFSARDAAGAVVVSEDCKFSRNYLGDAYQIKDIALSIAIRCVAAKCENDGFNYHELNGINPSFLEIDCVGYGNLAPGTGNGSTSHENCRGIRLNGIYYGNAGPGVVDVGTAKSHNAGGMAFNNSTYGIQASEQAEMWIDGFVSSGNGLGDIMATVNGILHYRDTWSGRDVITATDSAVVDTVMP